MIRFAVMPLALSMLAAPLAVNAQDGAAAPSDPCEETAACRVVAPLRVEAPDGEVSTVQMGMTLPWVTRGNVLLAPGDTVLVALDEIEGVLIPHLLATGEAAKAGELAEGQIRFDFSGIERGTVTLTVSSAFADPVEYAALKVSLADGPNRTSVCTLMPGLMTIEQWQEPIYQLALWGFRRGESMACTEIDLGTPDRLEQNR
jgi:hypothetical protein